MIKNILQKKSQWFLGFFLTVLLGSVSWFFGAVGLLLGMLISFLTDSPYWDIYGLILGLCIGGYLEYKNYTYYKKN